MFVTVATASITLFSCQSGDKQLPPGVGLNLAYMDTTVKAGDDFFQFVNGGWLAEAEIPADLGSYGSFTELRENSQEILLEILREAGTSNQYADDSDQRKAADFYSIGMDSALAERVGVEAIRPFVNEIEAIATPRDLQEYLERDMLRGGDSFFNMRIYPDLRNSSRVVVYLSAGGIGLPERDYYLKTDDKSKETRDRYKDHLKNLFVLAGTDPSEAEKRASTVMNIETRLASSMLSKEDRRDPYKSYFAWSVGDLQQRVPAIDWNDYLRSLGIDVDTLVVRAPKFMEEFNQIITQLPLNDVKTYLHAGLLRTSAPYLNHDFVRESFEFNQKYLSGVEQMRPRWKRVVASTNAWLGDAIGKLYVEKYFPPEAKKKAVDMVNNIKAAFGDRIRQLDWMSDSTKEKALEKLASFRVKIGYPEKWIDYSSLELLKDPEQASWYQNIIRASEFESRRQIAKLGKPVDREEWLMKPQTVNAYYNPVQNEIVFPAAILQPPFYDYRADEAVNYGGIGAVIGHEISHGFDDQGSKYDADGNLRNWFTEEDLARFREKGESLAKQFDQYEPLPGVFVQGRFTLGENIGDLGGVTAAFEGLQRHYSQHGKPGPIDGFTPEQRFFISWATIWRIKYRDETLRKQVLTDPHAPGMYRANGPLSNFTPFYEAFNVQPGDKMYRPESERVRIW